MKKSLLFLFLIASFTKISAQWTSQFSGFANPSRGLSQIKIVDANIVWGLAFDNTNTANTIQEFTKTTNGGASWSATNIDLGNPDLKIINICPVSATTAWLAAINPSQGRGGIYKTINGGTSWQQQLTNGFQSPASFLNGVYFFNENIGVAYGNAISDNRFEIYRTTNGGTSWTVLPTTSSTAINSNELGYNNDPIAAGGSLWFTTNKGRLYRSTDMGATFTAFQAPTSDFGGEDTEGTTATVCFSDASNGYFLKTVRSGTAPNYTYARSYAITTNGGQTWTPNTPFPFTGTRYTLTYVPGTTRIIATSADPINQGTSVSTDNGSTWTNVESAAPRGIPAFFNLTTGWCGGYSGISADGIYKLTGLLGTDTIKATSQFKVYPNPTTSFVTISSADIDSYYLSIVDLMGKTLMVKSFNAMENNLDVSALSTGIYFFELTSGSKKEVVKVLKN